MKHLYLHGFASGPTSKKAQAVKAMLAAHGLGLDLPDLNLPSFSHLTLSAMVAEAEARLQDQTVIWGSSLGGYLAALLAHRNPQRVRQLVVMAPAVEFPEAFTARTQEAQERWFRGEGVPVFHHVHQREVTLFGDLLADCARWPSGPSVSCPVQIFAGLHDEFIRLPTIERWASRQPHATLTRLDDGHELTASLHEILSVSRQFLGLNPLT